MRTGSHPVAVGLAEKPWPGQRRDHQMECVLRAPAVGGGISERLDDLQLLDDRAGPPMRHDQRQRVLMLGSDVDEVDVEPVDLRHEVRQDVQPRLALAPVVVGPPVARELLDHREPHTLRIVADRLSLGPPGRVYAPAQLDELGLRETDLKRTNSGVLAAGLLCSSSSGHLNLLGSCRESSSRSAAPRVVPRTILPHWPPRARELLVRSRGRRLCPPLS